jgi:hypothetical protein
MYVIIFFSLYNRKNCGMTIEMISKKPFQIIHVTSDQIIEADIIAIKESVEKALMYNFRNFIFSVSARAPSSQAVICALLLQCRNMISRNNCRMLFMEDSADNRSAYHCICQALRIPFYMKGKTRQSPEYSAGRPPN